MIFLHVFKKDSVIYVICKDIALIDEAKVRSTYKLELREAP